MKYGLYKEKLISLTKKGIHGNKEIKKIMNSFRNEPPKTIGNSQIIKIDDFESSTSLHYNNTKTNILLPKSNVLIFSTLDGTKVALRPSGTEPKIKFYISVNEKVNIVENYSSVENLLELKIKQIVLELKIS